MLLRLLTRMVAALVVTCAAGPRAYQPELLSLTYPRDGAARESDGEGTNEGKGEGETAPSTPE